MEIYNKDAGIELTIEEFRNIVKLDLLDDIISMLLELDGDFHILTREGELHDFKVKGASAPSSEDLKIIETLKKLGFFRGGQF